MPKNIKYLLIAVSVGLVGWFVIDAVSQPGVHDLKGGFEETAFYRNENNTGPIVRIYAITVAEPEQAELEAYGNYMPHTKYGTTKVFFFRKGQPAPANLSPTEPYFGQEFQQNVIATYEKDAMGLVSFRKL